MASSGATEVEGIRLHGHGGPEVMRWEQWTLPAPGPGQVLIRHTSVGGNFRDILVRSGGHAVKSFPTGLGLESAGVIEAVGPALISQTSDASHTGAAEPGLTIGQRVVCVAGPDGAYATARLVPANRVIPLPSAIDDSTAASMMIRGMTARYLLHDTYRVRPGDAILIHAAAGGVGLILCQWAKRLGAQVIGTVGTCEKKAVAEAHGCDHAIVYSEEDFVARVRELTAGEGVAVAYDSVGKATFEGSLACLRPRGVLASFGEASGEPEPIAPRRLGLMGSLFVTHPSLPDYTATRQALLANANDLFAQVASGLISIPIHARYPLREATRAHQAMQARATTGSIVLIA